MSANGDQVNTAFQIRDQGDRPLVAVALHDGHAVRDEVAEHLALTPRQRHYEEDPYTGDWATLAETHAVGHRSRFEVDLNRSPDQAVYEQPEDAWGLQVWEEPPPPLLIDRSLAQHEAFYGAMRALLEQKIEQHGQVLVLDLHSYCHRRKGPDAPPGNPELNPEIDVVTKPIDRNFWSPVVEPFIELLRKADDRGRRLDVRENVKFTGGYFSRWVRQAFPHAACPIMVEVKKIYMDEWTGELHEEVHETLHRALATAADEALEALCVGPSLNTKRNALAKR